MICVDVRQKLHAETAQVPGGVPAVVVANKSNSPIKEVDCICHMPHSVPPFFQSDPYPLPIPDSFSAGDAGASQGVGRQAWRARCWLLCPAGSSSHASPFTHTSVASRSCSHFACDVRQEDQVLRAFQSIIKEMVEGHGKAPNPKPKSGGCCTVS